ncbi:hypothetical protein ACVND7_11285 [Avibacterium paragallinarum]|uniref:Uncharacterized protein n=1 Tax=Avibacterium paragallinarum TaxID=728 RepID=A0ABU7QKZ0_AVIPA
MATYHIHSSAYHDGSTKGFRHGIKHKRHDCFRGDVKVLQVINGIKYQISRERKRFTNKEDAYQWAKQYALKMRQNPTLIKGKSNE